MPAYLASIVELCYTANCPKFATHELRTGQNDRIGLYCEKHGKDALARLRASEEARDGG